MVIDLFMYGVLMHYLRINFSLQMKSYYSLENLVVELINPLKLYQCYKSACSTDNSTTQSSPISKLFWHSMSYYIYKCHEKIKNMRFDIGLIYKCTYYHRIILVKYITLSVLSPVKCLTVL